MSKNIKIYNNIIRCSCFSLQCDKSPDIPNTAQLLIFIRLVFKDYTAKGELLGEISLKGVDILKPLKNFLISLNYHFLS